MANAKIQIVETTNHEFYFGNGSTPYAIFNCKTLTGDLIPVGISYDNLKSMGIRVQLLDKLTDSSIIVKDSTSRFTGEVVSGQETVEKLVKGELIVEDPRSAKFGKPTSILLLNRGNCSIIKSEAYDLRSDELVSKIESQKDLAKEKERKLERAQRVYEAMLTAPTTPVAEAVLETNDEEVGF